MTRNRLYRTFGQKLLRWTTALAVLLYVLIPQTGFCLCEGCDCSNKPPTLKEITSKCFEKNTEKVAWSAPNHSGGCCCSAKKAASVPTCCQKKTKLPEPCCSSGTSDSSSSPCECGCSAVKDSLPPTSDTPTPTQRIGEVLKEQIQSVSAFPILSVPFFDAVSPEERFETTVSRLPVRLHLMLLVLRN